MSRLFHLFSRVSLERVSSDYLMGNIACLTAKPQLVAADAMRRNRRWHPIINLKDIFFEPAVGSRPNFARMCG